jgi:hypothetical protein
MPIKSIVRAKGGEAKRELPLAEIMIPDFRVFALFLADARWIAAVARYYKEVSMLLAAVRSNLDLPEEFFVPDLWDISTKLPAQESELLRDTWSLGDDLACSTGYRRSIGEITFMRNGLGGTLYVR